MRCLRARWIVPMLGPPLDGGYVTCDTGRVCECGGQPQDQVDDLGDVALFPGWVNCHTHLEFSDLPRPLGAVGMPLPEWIKGVVAYRHGLSEMQRQTAVAHGVAEMKESATVLYGEIATDPWSQANLDQELPQPVVFQELLGLAEKRLPELTRRARQHLTVAWKHGHPGLSPHAPYTVSFELLEQAAQLSRDAGCSLAMHLAESPEEIRLLKSGDGPFAEMLMQLDAWQPDRFGSHAPLDYLKVLVTGKSALVIHGNLLDAAEIEFCGQHADRLSVIYCPRTHARFAHPRYPLRTMLQSGVRVVLGTDSRASNPDLNILSEAQQVAVSFPQVTPERVLRMITCDAAEALGMVSRFGSICPGASAAFAVVPLQGISDPYEAAMATDPKLVKLIYV